MLIGLISDSHGNTTVLQKAAEFFSGRVDIIIHCGDVTAPRHLNPLLDTQIPVHLSRGNCDRDPAGFERASRRSNLIYHDRAGWLEPNGAEIAFTHGDSTGIFYNLLNRSPDYLIQGHSHERMDQEVDSTRLINPGAATSSVALLDTETDKLEFHELNDS
jgi:hypothetical protein